MKHHRPITRTPMKGQTALAVKLDFKVGLSELAAIGLSTVSTLIIEIFDEISNFPTIGSGGSTDNGGTDTGGDTGTGDGTTE